MTMEFTRKCNFQGIDPYEIGPEEAVDLIAQRIQYQEKKGVGKGKSARKATSKKPKKEAQALSRAKRPLNGYQFFSKEKRQVKSLLEIKIYS